MSTSLSKEINTTNEKLLPLSFSQQRLWLDHQLEDTSDIRYNNCIAIQLDGKIDTAVLCNTLHSIVERHEILRTTFHSINAKAVQLIHDTINLNIIVNNTNENDIEELINQNITSAFDLSIGPLVRFNIFRLPTNSHILLITMHHIVTDTTSMQLFAEELSYIYSSSINKEQSSLKALCHQYQDFVHWQISWLNKTRLDYQLDYWQKQLNNLPTTLTLPTDFCRPAKSSYRGKRYQFTFSETLTQNINQLSNKQDHTMFTILLAVFVLLLSRYSNQYDICVGTPIPNRQNKRFEKLIGCFVNIIVLRLQVNSSVSFCDFLNHVDNTYLLGKENQGVPFEKLLEKLKPNRNTSHSPLFQVMFFVQNTTEKLFTLPGVVTTPVTIDTHTSKYDLSLILTKTDSGISEGVLEYSTDLFKNSTIKRMMEHYLTLLEDSLNNKNKRMFCLQMINRQEREYILFSKNKLKETYTSTQCIHNVFEQQIELKANYIAVVFNNQQLSYTELNQKSNQLAHYLIKQGVGPDTIVALFLNRSLDLIVAMLAILKAGGCYLPIDPTYPQQRISYLIKNSQVNTLLAHSDLANFAIEQLSAPILYMDKHSALLKNYSRENPNVATTSSNLAYINYTSGSTGQPKGVAITHQAVNRLVLNNNSLPLKKGSKLLQLASTSFDAATFEIWGALLNTGTCVLYPENMPTQHRLKKLISKQGIDTLWLTTALFNLIIDEKPDTIKPVKYVITGGETLSKKHTHKALTLFPDKEFFNVYGPTENTTFSTCYKISNTNIDSSKNIPIGQAIDNTSTYILDDNLNLTPIGIIGELYVGGKGLARGYLFNCCLTAEKFIPHPFSNVPGERLYKTGDLVRWLENKHIEFVGRADKQVKIRGYRIELSEIEHTLIQQPAVRTAIVTTNEKQKNRSSVILIAYIVMRKNNSGNANTQEILRNALQRQLPTYMIPTAFVFLDKLPVTNTGKLDYNSLPTPSINTLNQQHYVEPTTLVEKTLCRIWKHILQVDKVGIRDNFFAHGGDSILSLLIASQARDAGIKINAGNLFKHQNIEELARHSTTSIQKIPQVACEGEMQLLPIQKWFFSCFFSTTHTQYNHFNQYSLLRVPENFDSCFLREVVKALYHRHDALRLRFQYKNTLWNAKFISYKPTMIDETVIEYQLPNTKNTTDNEYLTFLEKHGSKVQKSLDIINGPMFKAVHFKSNNKQHSRLLLVIHHLVVDGVSWRVLLQDFTLAYNQWQNQQKITLSDKSSNLKLWSQKLYQYSTSNSLEKELEYWYKQLITPAGELPKNNKTTDYSNVEHISFSLNAEKTHALLTQCQHKYRARINELLLSGLALAYQQWCDQSVIRLNLEGHGREELFNTLDISQTLGWFTSIFPLTLQWNQHASIDTLIKSIKEQVRSIPANGIGYGLLYYLSKNKELQQLAQNNKPEIVFNYLGQFDQKNKIKSRFSRSFEAVGERISSQLSRNHTLQFTGEIIGETLLFTLEYDSLQFNQEKIQDLANFFNQALVNIIEQCKNINISNYTPSDFPLSFLDQNIINKWQQDYPTLEDIYPASKMQMGLLYHSQRNSVMFKNESIRTIKDPYIIQFHIVLKGSINTDYLKKAWRKTISRHSIFRTAFVDFPLGQTQQIVVTQPTINWQEQDWRNKPPEQFNIDLKHFKENDNKNTFDQKQASLMRFLLIKENNHCIHLLWTLHHSLLDGWSIPIVLKEIKSTYHYLNYNTSTSHSDVSLEKVEPYRNYIQWLLKQNKNKANIFWRKQLKGIQNTTLISSKSLVNIHDNKNKQQDKKSQQQTLCLSRDVTEKLKLAAKHYQVTLNTLVQAMWAYLLYCYSGNNDIIFGETLSGRPAELSGVEKIVGLLINTVPVRVTVNTEQSIEFWLKNIHHTQIQCERYGYLPLIDIQRCSQLTASTPLFNSLIAFQIDANLSNKSKNIEHNTLEIASIECNEQTHYDLTLAVIPSHSIKFLLKYNATIYSHNTIIQILNHVEIILTAFTDLNSKYINDFPNIVSAGVTTKNNSQNSANKHNSIESKHCEFIPPSTELEKQLVAIWSEVLEVNKDTISIHENFFELGGHSLFAIQIINRLYELHKVYINVDDMFKKPTIYLMVQHITQMILEKNIFEIQPIKNLYREDKGSV